VRTASIITALALIALIMEAVITPETSVNFYQTTQRNIPEDSLLHSRHRDNLKYHFFITYSQGLKVTLSHQKQDIVYVSMTTPALIQTT
jgi:hypothetical protein